MITCLECQKVFCLNESGGFAQCKGGKVRYLIVTDRDTGEIVRTEKEFIPNPPSIFIDVVCPHCGTKQEDRVLHG
jgi:ribosomal protein S27E